MFRNYHFPCENLSYKQRIQFLRILDHLLTIIHKQMKEAWFNLTPMQRDGDPRELKGIYLYLCSDASSYTTGSDFIIDGGYTCR